MKNVNKYIFVRKRYTGQYQESLHSYLKSYNILNTWNLNYSNPLKIWLLLLEYLIYIFQLRIQENFINIKKRFE